MEKWKTLSSTHPLNERWMKIRKDEVELPDGTVLPDYYVYEEGDVAFVVPRLKDGRFVLVRQYKHAAQDIMIEFPAGYIDEGEKPDEAAGRELKEETGLATPKLEFLGKSILNPSKVENTIHIYLAEGSEEMYDRLQEQDHTENIELVYATFEELHAMIKSGKVHAAGTVVAFYFAAEKLGLL